MNNLKSKKFEGMLMKIKNLWRKKGKGGR